MKYQIPTKVGTTHMKSQKQYRSATELVRQIMEIISDSGQEGVLISVIARKAGISHTSVLDKCQKLVDAGLLKTDVGHRSRRYYTTEEGLSFFAMLTKYAELLQTMNIRTEN